MRRIQIIVLSAIVLGTVVVASSFTSNTVDKKEATCAPEEKSESNQTINMFVTHGHCSLPFAGSVTDLDIVTQERGDQGNPLENMEISFSIDPDSFFACRGEDLTERIKTPGLFINKKKEKLTFKSTSVYTMGLDWYQVNGRMSIKGVEKEVKFFASGIRNLKESMATHLVIEGQLDLWDWGIDYDLIVNGKSDDHPTKWMHLNMKVDLTSDC